MDKTQLDEYIHNITNSIQKTCDKLIPRATGPPKRAPWWNEQLSSLKRTVLQIHHKICNIKRRGNHINPEILLQKLNAQNKYSNAIRTASTNSFREFCQKQKKEDVWSITNRLIKTRPITQPPSTLLLEDGTYTNNTLSTATALINNFFPDDTPDHTNYQITSRAIMHHPIHNPYEPPFTTSEIIETLKTINHKKAPGPDHLTADICLQFAKASPNIITQVLNRCLALEYFPKSWKIAQAKIIPKPNKSNYTDLSKFRTIGLINVFGKLLEKLIINRLTHHMNVTNTYFKSQYGFKLQTSTVDAIRNALNTIKTAKNNKEHVIAVSLDIKSAFDNAWWPAIFLRLRKINCPSNIYRILLSYVEDREVFINFSDCTVNKKMSRGCVQGSVCGPTLWNLILEELLNINLPDGY
ncbi:unnamed protein product, partial [Iphiclides podalirius]